MKKNLEKLIKINFKKSSKYLLKTIKMASKDTEYAYLLDGAINVLKYKFVTHSKAKINKKLYFKLLYYVDNKKFKESSYTEKDKKFVDIYKYLCDKTLIKNFNTLPSKSKLKKFLKNNYKKYIFLVFQENKEIEKEDDEVNFQDKLLVKRIKNSKNLLKDIEGYIDSYIKSLENIFSHKTLMNFRWKFNALKEILKKHDINNFLSKLKNILLYKKIKYIYIQSGNL